MHTQGMSHRIRLGSKRKSPDRPSTIPNLTKYEPRIQLEAERPAPKPTIGDALIALAMDPIAPPATQFIADEPTVGERFLRCRKRFQSKNKPNHVRVGFHYTIDNGKRIDEIKKNGMLSSEDVGVRNGQMYGPGIYICDNPHAFSMFGDTGILVFYIAGSVQQLQRTSSGRPLGPRADSFRGNKLTKNSGTRSDCPKTSYYDEVIVSRAEQVIPVYAYPRTAINNAEHMYRFHVKAQELVDRYINFPDDYDTGRNRNCIPRKTYVPRIFPSYDDLHYERKLYERMADRIKEYRQLKFLPNGMVVPTWRGR